MEKIGQIIFTAITSWVAATLGALYIPLCALLLCNLIDYATGIMAAGYREDKGISSYKSIKGIFKKICMWLLILVGAVIDLLIKFSGATLPFSYIFAAAVAIWITCNEIISILENMIDIGVEVPGFLRPIVEKIKKQTEDSVKMEDDKNDL